MNDIQDGDSLPVTGSLSNPMQTIALSGSLTITGEMFHGGLDSSVVFTVVCKYVSRVEKLVLGNIGRVIAAFMVHVEIVEVLVVVVVTAEVVDTGVVTLGKKSTDGKNPGGTTLA